MIKAKSPDARHYNKERETLYLETVDDYLQVDSDSVESEVYTERRSFIAAMTLKYCGGGARMAETVFGWSKYTATTGLGEKRTGITCLGAQSASCGNIRWEARELEAAEVLCLIAESHSQQYPTFHSTIRDFRKNNLPIIKQSWYS